MKKIVIAGGNAEAEYIAHLFNKPGNRLVVINPSRAVADKIVQRENVKVYVGDPWKKYTLEESGASDADLFISLLPKDTDNYAACMMAKTAFGAHRCICVVSDPQNVDIYAALGIDSVISASYLLGQRIQDQSSLENAFKSTDIEEGSLVMIEATVLSHYLIASKMIRDIHFPKYASICAIMRKGKAIIPSGDVMILPQDKLFMVCAPENVKALKSFVRAEDPNKKGKRDMDDELLDEAHMTPEEKAIRKAVASGNGAQQAPQPAPIEPKAEEKPAEFGAEAKPIEPQAEEKPVEPETEAQLSESKIEEKPAAPEAKEDAASEKEGD